MDNVYIEEGIINEARRIAMSSGLDSLFESQLSYWLSVQTIMKTSGYDELRKKIPHISEQLAEKISNLTYGQIAKLCNSQISTIRPSLSEDTLINILENKFSPRDKTLSVMQLLAS